MEFKLPEIGEGVQEGELIQWLVKEGDVVESDQALLEVMTDKATVEVPAPTAGKISGLTAKDGDMIKVGQILATIAGGASSTPEKTENKSESKGEAKPAEETKAPASDSAPASTVSSPAKGHSYSNGNGNGSANGSHGTPVGNYASALDANSASTVPAAPIVRSMAQKAGVSLDQVPASGPEVGGHRRVLEADLLKYLEGQSSGSATPQSSPNASRTASTAGDAPAAKAIKTIPNFQVAGTAGGEERQPVRGLRRVIAKAMSKSKYTAPHYSYVDEFECSSLFDIRNQAKIIGEDYGVKITYLPFIVKAVVGALREFPIVNSSLDEKEDGTMELVLKKYFHIGFAVATPDGLIVPVIKNADQKSLLQIAAEMAELSEKVRKGKATSDELKGSSFSITSMGNIGGLFATPIINYPEVGILGVYKIQEKPVVQNGQIVVGKTMNLSLSLDHRVVDGAVGGHFCNAIIERLRNPARLLLEMS